MQGEMDGEFERQYAALKGVADRTSSTRTLGARPGEGELVSQAPSSCSLPEGKGSNCCGIVVLTDWSSVTVAGRDRQKFLHNFCTNDIKRLQPGDSCEAFFLNVKGRILGHGVVSCRESELVVFGEPGQAETLVAHLDRYQIREDVQLRDTTAERSFILVAGGEVMKDALGRVGNADGGISAAIRCGWLDSEVECVLETGVRDRDAVVGAFVDAGGVVASDALETVRVEAGWPLFGVDFSRENLPQEVGRDRQAISFTKGCYLGQETVARIDALGHINQRIVGVQFQGRQVPRVGCELMRNASVVGRVTSAVDSPRLSAPLALALLRSEAITAGTQFDSPVGECEVVALPLLG